MATKLDDTLAEILATAESYLDSTGRPVARKELVPGRDEAWDDCCAGQLYLRVGDIYPTTTLPNVDVEQRGGVITFGLNLAIGVIRCASTLDEAGKPPSAERVTDDGLSVFEDAVVLSQLLRSLVAEPPGEALLVKIGRWAPKPVSGGCAGGEWTFSISVDPSCLVWEADAP